MRYRGAVALVVAPMVLAGFGLVAIVVGHGTTGIALLVASLILRVVVRLSGPAF